MHAETKWGAFTPDGKEPKPPADTLLPDIEAEWTPGYNRLVDAATGDEILDKLNAVADESRTPDGVAWLVPRQMVELRNGLLGFDWHPVKWTRRIVVIYGAQFAI